MTSLATDTKPAAASAPPSGLTAEQRTALADASQLLSSGQSPEVAVERLIETGMPRMIAKVLVKQQQRSLN